MYTNDSKWFFKFYFSFLYWWMEDKIIIWYISFYLKIIKFIWCIIASKSWHLAFLKFVRCWNSNFRLFSVRRKMIAKCSSEQSLHIEFIWSVLVFLSSFFSLSFIFYFPVVLSFFYLIFVFNIVHCLHSSLIPEKKIKEHNHFVLAQASSYLVVTRIK